jgi:RNA polymerase sigma-70 factor (ECF subfamily)
MDYVLPKDHETKQQPAETRMLSDRELAVEVLRRDRKATAEFVGRFADHIYGYVQRRLFPRTDLADDLVQEVFLAAWESLDQFRGDSSLHNWLLGIARHKVEDHYRKSLREVQLLDEEESSTPVPAGFLDREEVLDRQTAEKKVQGILASLPEPYRVVLLWRYWEKRSLGEIAAQTGKTEKAIERLLARARHQFKKGWNER